MNRSKLELLFWRFGAQLAILVGAYVSLGTSCGSVAREADFERNTRLPVGSDEGHLQLSIRSDGRLQEIRVRLEPNVPFVVDVATDDITGDAATAQTSEGNTRVIDCRQLSCDEVFLTFERNEASGELDVEVAVSVVVEGDCGGSAPEFVEVEFTELDS